MKHIKKFESFFSSKPTENAYKITVSEDVDISQIRNFRTDKPCIMVPGEEYSLIKKDEDYYLSGKFKRPDLTNAINQTEYLRQREIDPERNFYHELRMEKTDVDRLFSNPNVTESKYPVNENFMDAPEAQKALNILNDNRKNIFKYGLELQRKGDNQIKWNSVLHTDLKAICFEWLKENDLFEPEGLNLWDIPVNDFSIKNASWYYELRRKDPSYRDKY